MLTLTGRSGLHYLTPHAVSWVLMSELMGCSCIEQLPTYAQNKRAFLHLLIGICLHKKAGEAATCTRWKCRDQP